MRPFQSPSQMLPEPSQASSTHQHTNDECPWMRDRLHILQQSPLPHLANAPPIVNSCTGICHPKAHPPVHVHAYARSNKPSQGQAHYQLSQPHNIAQRSHLTLAMLLRGFLVGLSVVPPCTGWYIPGFHETLTLTHQAPRVRVFAGMNTGSPGIPQGYPWQSLSLIVIKCSHKM